MRNASPMISVTATPTASGGAPQITRGLLFQRRDRHGTVTARGGPLSPALVVSDLHFPATARETPESSNRVIGLRVRAHQKDLR